MRRHATNVALALGLIATGPLLGQVTILSTAVNGSSIGPTTLFHATLSNVGPELLVEFSGSLIADEGVVVDFVSAPYRLASGVRILSASDLGMQRFVHGRGPVAREVAMEHRLSAGVFRFCLEVRPLSGGEGPEDHCEDIVVDDLLFMDLVFPQHKDTIDELRPALSWMISSGRVPAGQTARLVLVPNEGGRSASQSVASEIPLFVVEDLRSPIVPFPSGVKSLEPGRCYAWEVERLSANAMIDRTEPWTFCVRKKEAPEPDRYVVIGETNGVYRPTDGWVRFRFKDAYASNSIRFSIVDEAGRAVAAADDREQGILEPSVGRALFELDLDRYHLRKGYYTLLLKDAKGHVSELKFHIER